MTRLVATVQRGDREAFVGTNLGWLPGQKLFFAPTTLQHDHYDVMTIETYDESTGRLTLTEEFPNYHYGA